MDKVKFIDITTYDFKNTGTTFTDESLTRQSDYEDVNTMVARIIRGEVIPQMPEEFEYDESYTNEQILAQPHPFDEESYDFSDAGSLYQDDIRAGFEELSKQGENHQVINQEQEQSGANKQSSSDANVPVDNLDLNETK